MLFFKAAQRRREADARKPALAERLAWVSFARLVHRQMEETQPPKAEPTKPEDENK